MYDRIVDFQDGVDAIDLSQIDSNVYASGNQAFNFIGTAAFSGKPGEVRYYHSGSNTYIEMQTGASVDIEGAIRLDGIHTPNVTWFSLSCEPARALLLVALNPCGTRMGPESERQLRM